MKEIKCKALQKPNLLMGQKKLPDIPRRGTSAGEKTKDFFQINSVVLESTTCLWSLGMKQWTHRKTFMRSMNTFGVGGQKLFLYPRI